MENFEPPGPQQKPGSSPVSNFTPHVGHLCSRPRRRAPHARVGVEIGPIVQISTGEGDELADSAAALGYAPAFRLGYYAGRSGELFWAPRPYWVAAAAGTTHGTPYNYDAQVPILLSGAGVAPGRRLDSVSPTQLAPTLCALLDMGRPAQAEAPALPLSLSK